MNRLLFPTALLLSTCSLGLAAPCAPGTLASYLALGSTGCSIGNSTFTSFSTLFTTSGASAIPPSSITITPNISSTSPGLTFQVTANVSQASVEARFLYVISGGSILNSQISLANSSAGGDGIVTFIQDACANGSFSSDGVTGCTGTAGEQLLLSDGSNQVSFRAASSVTVSNDLTVDGGLTGSGSAGTFTNRFDVLTQACSYTVTPGNQTASASASVQTQTITTSAQCSWQAVSNVPWITISSPSSGTGNGTVSYQIQSNAATTPRTGTLTIAGQTIAITQSGASASGPSSATFVTALYRDLLNRAPDSGGFNYYVNALDSGLLTRSQAAVQFFTSPEFSSAGLYVIKLYFAILKRDPDFQGWAFWFNSIDSGVPPISVLNSFLTSPEFQMLYGNTDNAAFVTLVYQNVLGRQPDPGGFNFYLGLLNNGMLSRAQMLDQFVRSPEYDASTRARAYANLLYMGFLKRTADAGGLAFWTGVLANPNNLSNAIQGFISSPEYLARF